MRKYVFADEAGDFNFSRTPGASRYFIACAISMTDCDIGLKLLELRRDLAWRKFPVREYFHASEERQSVRDAVFDLIKASDFKVYAQVLEKSKCQPHIRSTDQRFYQHAWFYLFKNTMPKIVGPLEELMVTTASIGTNKGKKVFSEAVSDVLTQTVKLRPDDWRTSFCLASSDPCLQIADYCTWAIQRKWEKGDDRSYRLIKDRIVYEFDLWGRGTAHFY